MGFREKINEKLENKSKFADGEKYKSRSNGAVLEIKRICDKMMDGHLGRIDLTPLIQICIDEIKEAEINLQEFRDNKPWLNE